MRLRKIIGKFSVSVFCAAAAIGGLRADENSSSVKRETTSRPAETSVRIIKEFPVKLGNFYTVQVTAHPAAAGAEIEVRFFDDKNQDISVVDGQLGFALSVFKGKIPPGGKPLTLITRAGTMSTNPRRGKVFLRGATTAQIAKVAVEKGAASDTRTAEAGGIDTALTGEGDFAANLAPNPSFEEVNPDGTLVGWTYEGAGKGLISTAAFAGARALKVTQENPGRWVSAPFALSGNDPLRVAYQFHYPQYAKPHGHPDPLRAEFLCADGNGGFKVIPHPKLEINRNFFQKKAGGWVWMISRPYTIPAGATHARLYLQHQEKQKIWQGVRNANWGEIVIDNVACWQVRPAEIPADLKALLYAEILYRQKKLPPRLPLGKIRARTVWAMQARPERCGFFYASENRPAAIGLYLANLTAYDRKITLRGRVLDDGKKKISDFSSSCELTPYELTRKDFPLPQFPRYGAYEVEFTLLDGATEIDRCSAHAAWLAHPNQVAIEEKRDSAHYPFWMHPTGFMFNKICDNMEYQLSLGKILGFAGVRLQYSLGRGGFDADKSVAGNREAARKMVAGFRQKQKPLLERHQVRCFVSLGEQGAPNLKGVGADPEKLEKFSAYCETLARELGNDVEFIVFGNEGIGNYTADIPFNDTLENRSAFHGSAADWWKMCRAALEGLRRGNPQLKIGLCHANDPEGKILDVFNSLPEKDAMNFDIWGMNSYGQAAANTAVCVKKLGKEIAARTFGVIPEIGAGSSDPGYDRRLQAAAIPYAYLSAKAASNWMRCIAWFILHGPNDLAILDGAGAPYPGAVAYAVMTDLLGAGEVVGVKKLSDGGKLLIWKRTNNEIVAAGWSPKKLKISLATDAPEVTAYDLYGNPTTLKTSRGEVLTTLKSAVTYFAGGQLRFVENLQATVEKPLTLKIKNLSSKEIKLTVTPRPHPLVTVRERRKTLSLAPGGEAVLPFAYSVQPTSQPRIKPVAFAISDENGVTQETAIDDVPVPAENSAWREIAENLLRNPQFTQWENGKAANWEFNIRKDKGARDFECRHFCARDNGRNAAAINVPILGRYNSRAEISQKIRLQPRTRYYFSAMQKSIRAGHWSYPVLNLSGKSLPCKAAPAYPGTDGQGYTRMECGFTTDDKKLDLTVILRMHCGHGEIHFRDVELFKIAAPQ